MPASEALLTMFITCHGTASVSSSTLHHWLLGLELWHAINGAPWLGHSTLRRAVKAAARLAPHTSRRKRDPLTIQHLECLRNDLDFEDPFDASVYALACLAFWSQARLGELSFDNAFDPLTHVVRGSLAFGSSSSNRLYGKCWLPRTKMKPLGDWLLFTDSQCATSAL